MRCRKQAVLATFVAVVAIATTAPSAPAAFSYGTIQSSCAPWRGLPVQSGQVVKFAPGSDAGFASRCKKEGTCERAQSGTITFDRYEVGSGASGRYELHFKGDETLSGTFDVKWCDERVICG